MNEGYLGIELGSTRIKAVIIDKETKKPLSCGSYLWKSEKIDDVWTYDISEVWRGVRKALSELRRLEGVISVGVSGMMHGYLAFDESWQLLTPFRTWQNTMTGRSAAELTELFGFNLPERWSAAHLYEAILSGEEHTPRVAHVTTLAGYVHYMLTGVNAVGIGEASGIFPIDSDKLCYDEEMIDKFNSRLSSLGFSRKAEDVFPKVLTAGDFGGRLTEEGSRLLGGLLSAGLPFAAPEGDAGTGMVATNSISYNTGNVSAGTSIFAMVVLEKRLNRLYKEIDMVTTPDGKPVAMVHCNNCTTDINAWVSLLKETLNLFGKEVSDGELYTKLYETSLLGDKDCGGVFSCNYTSGESITGIGLGIPMVIRAPGATLSLSNFMRSHIFSSFATLRIGMEIFKKEGVEISRLTGHGGLFKTEGVAQSYLSSALGTDVVCLETSGEGGPYGMALLAAYSIEKDKYGSLDNFLDHVFKGSVSKTVSPTEEGIAAFEKYMEGYGKLLSAERVASDLFS